jgi:hypothetical protein
MESAHVTARRAMSKPATLVALAAGLAAAGSAAPAYSREAREPCGGCLVPVLTMAQAQAVLLSDAPLAGLRLVLVPGREEAQSWFAIVGDLRARGASPGFVIAADEAAPLVPLARELDTVVLDVGDGPLDAARTFRVRSAATELRAVNPALRVVLAAGQGGAGSVGARAVLPYVDAVLLDVATEAAAFFRPPPTGVAIWRRLPASGPAVSSLVELSRAGAERILVAPASDPLQFVRRVREVAAFLPPGLALLNEVRVGCDAHCDSEVYLDPQTLDAVAVIRPWEPVTRLDVRPRGRSLDVLSDVGLVERLPPTEETPGGGTRFNVPAQVGTFLVRIAGWRAAGAEAFATGVEVKGTRPLSVEEIVARHQAARARQERRVQNVISSGETVLTFEVPGFTAPLIVTATTVIYTTGSLTEIEQRQVRVNGADLGANAAERPRLPLLEADPAVSPPLLITLDALYRYRLAGRAIINGRACYVVAFDPLDRSRSLFAGRAWILADSFQVARTDAAQTGLRGPIISSEERTDFVPVLHGPEEIWLPGRSEVHQVYEGAGHRTPIHRVVLTPRHLVNASDFAARLGAARQSRSVMLRRTPDGYRYLTRRRTGDPGAGGAPPIRTLHERPVSPVRTAVLGIIVDPNITRPLPFGGLNYLDLDFFRIGLQLNAFVGAGYGQVSWARPSIAGTRWQLAGDFFGLLAEYHDRSFRNGVEQYAENVKQRPARVAVALVRPLTSRVGVRLGYSLDYTRYRAAESTEPGFRVPASTPVHGVRLAVEWHYAPWAGAVWWSAGRRQEWHAWGWTGTAAGDASRAGFSRFGAHAARSFVFSPRRTARFEVAAMSGHALDRFSRFTFGSFENPLRGYPSASLRYDYGAVARGVISWTTPARVRLDGFVDEAVVRDPGFGRRPRGYTGLGVAAEVPLPSALLLSLEYGYGVQARTKTSVGAHVVRVTAYKVF